MNVIARLEYELAYYDSAVHRFNHYTTRTPPIAGRWIIRFIPFTRVLVLCEMQSVSSRIWTRVVVSISYDDNHYTTGTSFNLYLSLLWRQTKGKQNYTEFLKIVFHRGRLLVINYNFNTKALRDWGFPNVKKNPPYDLDMIGQFFN